MELVLFNSRDINYTKGRVSLPLLNMDKNWLIEEFLVNISLYLHETRLEFSSNLECWVLRSRCDWDLDVLKETQTDRIYYYKVWIHDSP